MNTGFTKASREGNHCEVGPNYDMRNFNETSTTCSGPEFINLEMIEGLAKQEIDLEKLLKQHNLTLKNKKQVYDDMTIKLNKLSQDKRIIQQKILTEGESNNLLEPLKETLQNEIDHLLDQENSLQAVVYKIIEKLTLLKGEINEYNVKIARCKYQQAIVQSNSEMGRIIHKDKERNIEIKEDILILKNNIEEFHDLYDCDELSARIKVLQQEKIKLQSILKNKEMEVETESKICTKKLQEKDVMWKCHQAKKRRLRSEIARMTQVREQQFCEMKKIKENIESLSYDEDF